MPTTADEDLAELRALKREVQAATAEATDRFSELVALNDRLIAMGGTATTRADSDGYCSQFHAMPSGQAFALGACKAQDAVNVDFGEELHAASERWREAAMKMNTVKAAYETRLKLALEG